MRQSQPVAEKKAWAPHFLGLLRESQPDYVINKKVRGIRVECLRPVEDGLIHSQNTICIHGIYRHGFAVLLSPAPPSSFLNSPFQAGGRLDDNFTIHRAFVRDLGAPSENHPRTPHDSHSWRSGTDDIVRKCTAAAEAHLPAVYRNWFRTAAPELLALLETTARLAPAWTTAPGPTESFVDLSLPDRAALDITVRDLANLRSPWYDRPKATRHALMVQCKPALFAAQLPYLDAMAGTLEAILRD
jgi:hypothetical protein